MMRTGGYTSDASTSIATEDDDDGDLSDASASMETMDPKRRLIEAIRAWNRSKSLVTLWCALSIAFIVFAPTLLYVSLATGLIGVVGSLFYMCPAVRGRGGALSALGSVKIISACCCALNGATSGVALVVACVRAKDDVVGVSMGLAFAYGAHAVVSYEVYRLATRVLGAVSDQRRLQ
jgi:hypothetical protein